MDNTTPPIRITDDMWIELDDEIGYAPVREIIRLEVWPDESPVAEGQDPHCVRAYLAHDYILRGDGPVWEVQNYATLHWAESESEANWWMQCFIEAMGGRVPYAQLREQRDKAWAEHQAKQTKG